jgi:hypothetical protein
MKGEIYMLRKKENQFATNRYNLEEWLKNIP